MVFRSWGWVAIGVLLLASCSPATYLHTSLPSQKLRYSTVSLLDTAFLELTPTGELTLVYTDKDSVYYATGKVSATKKGLKTTWSKVASDTPTYLKPFSCSITEGTRKGMEDVYYSFYVYHDRLTLRPLARTYLRCNDASDDNFAGGVTDSRGHLSLQTRPLMRIDGSGEVVDSMLYTLQLDTTGAVRTTISSGDHVQDSILLARFLQPFRKVVYIYEKQDTTLGLADHVELVSQGMVASTHPLCANARQQSVVFYYPSHLALANPKRFQLLSDPAAPKALQLQIGSPKKGRRTFFLFLHTPVPKPPVNCQ